MREIAQAKDLANPSRNGRGTMRIMVEGAGVITGPLETSKCARAGGEADQKY